jgi:hypothetical protein
MFIWVAEHQQMLDPLGWDRVWGFASDPPFLGSLRTSLSGCNAFFRCPSSFIYLRFNRW